MPLTDPYQNIDLDTLLEHIRRRGITVGTVELQHLHHVFSRSPVLVHNELRDLLGALLAKDDNQRQTINRLFDQLIPVDRDPQAEAAPTGKTRPRPHKAVISDEEEAETDEQETVKEPLNIWKLGVRALMIAALLLGGLATLMTLDNNPPVTIDAPAIPGEKPTDTKEAEPDIPEAGDFKLVKTIDLWTPEITVSDIETWPRLLPPLLLFLGAGLGFIWLLQHALKKTRLKIPKAPKFPRGKGRFHIPALAKQADYHLLTGDDRREMSWGIHHYLSDTTLDKLDIERSVQQSARIGIPQIAFQRASREREVWLWQDQSSSNPDLIRHIDEIARTLIPANIHVQRGYFRGIPDLIRNGHGEIIWSTRHEYPENQPLVVIFSDAQRLSMELQQQSDPAIVTLRLLSEWSQLCFADHSQPAGNLAALLAPYPLDCILPHEVSGWLAQQGEMLASSSDVCVLDSLHRWAVACCLPDRILTEDEIRALHDALGLSCGWQFHALKRYAVEHGQGLDFRAVRTGLLNEFSQAVGSDPAYTQTALNFWRQRGEEIDRSLLALEIDGGRRWDKTRKQQLLYLDQALLALWREPDAAVTTLYNQHANKDLRPDVERKLGHYTSVGLRGDSDEHAAQRVLLPWRWDSLDAEVQQQLLLCGFGGVADKTARLQLDKPTGVVLSLLAGLTLSGLVGSVYALWPTDTFTATRLDSPQPSPSLVVEPTMGKKYTVGTHKSVILSTKKDVEKYNQRVEVSWTRQAAHKAQFEEKDLEDTEVWLLGTEVKPVRPATEWPELSLAVIAGDVNDMNTQRLAAHLLDTGNVDRVVIGEAWYPVYQEWLGMTAGLNKVQWLFVGDEAPRYPENKDKHTAAHLKGSPAELLRLLQQDNKTYPVSQFADTGKVQGSPLLIGRKPEPPDEIIELANNLKLVKIPRGRFQMGSNNGDDNEKPVHTVNINYDFWMGQTEVTFAQYDAYVADREEQSQSAVSKKIDVPEKPGDSGWGRNTQPVINVSWDDAQGYVRWLTETNGQGLSCRLPSEAEWEYTARAGTTTDYPWGDTASHEQANYGKDECCGGLAEGKDQWENTAPVGQFPPNQFGLYDMHGNVLEWVQDCYQDHYQGAFVNGSAQEVQCDDNRLRVLRGGSWFVTPYLLRSALRDRFYPDDRNNAFGFRVVCSPP